MKRYRDIELGVGAYSVAEVARYTGIHRSTVRAWFRGRSDRAGKGPVFLGDYTPTGGAYLLSFLDMVEALVVGDFRRADVPMSTIRRAHAILTSELDSPHPFAHMDLYTDGQAVIGSLEDVNDGLILQDVVTRQRFFKEVRRHLHHVDYSEATRLAARWRIARGVVVDPRLSFGSPVVEGKGVTTYVLSRQAEANGGDVELVADMYCVSPEDVLNAIQFEQQHGRRHAA